MRFKVPTTFSKAFAYAQGCGGTSWRDACRNSCNYTPESKRKFTWGYIPARERVLLEGDEKIMPLCHYLRRVNEFFRYDRQLRTGEAQLSDIDGFRREVEPVVRRLIELCGCGWISHLCSGYPE